MVDIAGQKKGHKKFKNNLTGFLQLLEWVSCFEINVSELLFCMEHTGIYGRSIHYFLQDHQQALWLESSLQIKRSLGIQRGKNDKIDSYRIATYAQMRQHCIKLTPHYQEDMDHLHDLLTTRNRLMKYYHALRKPQEELKDFDATSYRTIASVQEDALDGILKSIKKVEAQIDLILDRNEAWKKNIELGSSIKGLGRLTILWFLVYTRNFDEKFTARRIAAFIGIAPFEISSGTSIRGGTHISKLAHLHLKGLLHTNVMAAIRHNPETNKYFKRKKEEGKKGLLVMNNIKNKMIHTLIAVIRSGNPYDPEYRHPRVAA